MYLIHVLQSQLKIESINNIVMLAYRNESAHDRDKQEPKYRSHKNMKPASAPIPIQYQY